MNNNEIYEKMIDIAYKIYQLYNIKYHLLKFENKDKIYIIITYLKDKFKVIETYKTKETKKGLSISSDKLEDIQEILKKLKAEKIEE